MNNLESKRRQYDLVDVARQRGFIDVEVIDDDLGRSASGTVARPGFDRLVAGLCAGRVGAVLCFDASRLARNGRDWHHLLELCGLVEARVIDLDGVYNPCRPNDRLLLGMKGSISEFELGVLRSRMLDAARSKASRGELRVAVPFGYIWHREAGLGFDPDLRLQEVIRLIFVRFRELGSARQVLLSMRADQVHFPRPSDEGRMTNFEWMPIRYRNVISILKNPFYAGVYVYGKSEKRTSIVDGRARRSYGHGKPVGTWEVMIQNHHESYIGWAEYERNQKQLALNNYGRAGGTKSGRGGRALLSGIMICGRCGRRLSVAYTGNPQSRPVYRCDKPNLMMGLPRCMTFGGPRVDAAVVGELMQAVEPMAIDAAFEGSVCTGNNRKISSESWTWNCSRRAMTQASPSVDMQRAIPIIVSLPPSWKRTGRPHCAVSMILKHAAQANRRQRSRLIPVPLPISQTIYQRRGMRRVLPCAVASNCSGH
jgi:DNA invertase Pin-like site-specific DNA recombinase